MSETLPMRPFAALAALVAVTLPSCLAPTGDDGASGSFGELTELLSQGDPQPVQAEVGTEPLDVPAGDGHALADPDDVVLAPDDVDGSEEIQAPPAPPPNPYLRFGARIVVRDTPQGEVISKPYPLAPGKGKKMVELMKALQPFPFKAHKDADAVAAETVPPDPLVAEVVVLEKWDFELYGNFAVDPPVAPVQLDVADWLVVTAGYELLEEVEAFIDSFVAGVPQIELEAKIIEIVESDSLDVGVKPPSGQNLIDFPAGTLVNAFGQDFSNSVNPTEAFLTLGAVQDGVTFNAILEAVSSWENVSIDSRPKQVVREGAVAKIESTIEVPFFTISGITSFTGGFSATLTFKEVGVKLYVAPRVVGTSMLALDVNLEASQVVGTQISFVTGTGEEIANPVIARRTAKTVVYLEPGQTLILGGLTQERTQEIVKKAPILGDLPVLGFFFRSTFEETQKEHVLFAITPRIIQSSEFHTDI